MTFGTQPAFAAVMASIEALEQHINMAIAPKSGQQPT
jgi:hypothetical protein